MNQLDFDDSLLQLGWSQRSKEFISFEEGTSITTNRSTFVNKEINNDPAFIILLGFDRLGISY